jgi:protein BCP1
MYRQPASKKAKKTKSAGSANSGLFPLADRIRVFRHQSALHKHTFDFKTSQARNEESFGVEQKGRISIYEAAKMQPALKIMEDALA